jgi:hypothetical protein
MFEKINVIYSVAEPVHTCAAPAKARQTFRLRLQPRPFFQHTGILEKIQKFSMLCKNINPHQKVLFVPPIPAKCRRSPAPTRQHW